MALLDMDDKTIGDDDLIIDGDTVLIDRLTFGGKGNLILTNCRVTAYVQDVRSTTGGSIRPTIRWEPSIPNAVAPLAPRGRGGNPGSDATCASVGCGLHAGGGGGGGNDGNSLDGIVPPKVPTPIGYLQIQAEKLTPPDIDIILWDGVPGRGCDGGTNGVGWNHGGNGGRGADCAFATLDAGIGGDGGNGGNGGNGSDGGLPSDGGYFYIYDRPSAKLHVSVVPRGANKAGLGTAGGLGGVGGSGSTAGAAGKPGSRGNDGTPSTATGKPITVVTLGDA